MKLQLVGYHLVNNQSGLDSIQHCYPYLDRIIPTWVEIKADGNLKEKQSEKDQEVISHLDIRLPVAPLVQNSDLDSRVSNRLLEDPQARKNAVENLIVYLQLYKSKGLNLDLEGVKVENKKLYTSFIAMLGREFHKRGFRLGLSIPAKSKNNRDSSWSGAYSYRELGELADEIIIMAYDYHWAGGTPGPIAPLFWVKDVIDYALLEMPLNKIFLGVPFYGYDWIVDSDKRARGLSYQGITALQQKYGVELEWDQESSSPYLRYHRGEEEHEVWFEDRESLLKKISLVREYQLAGAAFWRLGLEDESFWKGLEVVKP